MAAYKVTDADLQEVLDFIPNAQFGGRPISRGELAHCLGLGLGQVSYRIRLLREHEITVTVDGRVDRVPLLSSRQGYILSTDADDNAEFRGRRRRTGLTIFRLTFNEAVERFIATLPAAERAGVRRRLERAWTRIIEDIGDLVTTTDGRPPSHKV